MPLLTEKIENNVFTHRKLVLVLFLLMTMVMLYFASQIRVDAGFNKLIPLQHEYMQTFVKYQKEFGGANRVLVALVQKDGDIFNPEFFKTLKAATDDVFFIPGVNRSSVKSLFTPNVRFIEVVEGGFSGGNVIPADFKPTPERLQQVKKNVLKSNYVGRLVSADFSAALISAELLETDPTTAAKLNYKAVADRLEHEIRAKYASDKIDVHIIGFAKVVGDVIEGATSVITFFIIAFIITAILLYIYSLVLKLTLLPLLCSSIAVIWQLGLLTALGFGIDPMSILVPFLVFAIGISHGVQMINAMRVETGQGADSLTAARRSFRRLLIPGGAALLSDTVGFLTVLLIDIRIIQEMAITASIGVAVIILTNLFLLPVLMSYIRIEGKNELKARAFWSFLSQFAERRVALITILVAIALGYAGLWKGEQLKIGDLQAGVPELHQDSRYNLDTAVITNKFNIGVDIISLITETVPDGCTKYGVMNTIDQFEWHVRNVPGVQSVLTLPGMAKRVNAGWNEGNPKWQVLSRNKYVLAQSVTPIDTSTGLLNPDCSVMPVLVFLADHKAETIAGVVDAVKAFNAQNKNPDVNFRLASNNVGVMAATNEAVDAAQIPMLIYVYAAVIVLCVIAFRSLRATICIITPLALVSILTYALMAMLDIGLKVATLPVVALGVGIGIDYGIYIFSRLKKHLEENLSLKESYLHALHETGNAVFFTALTLAAGVSTWIFSALKFQVDMGILLTFMFLVNMLGAVLLLPGLAAWLYKKN